MSGNSICGDYEVQPTYEEVERNGCYSCGYSFLETQLTCIDEDFYYCPDCLEQAKKDHEFYKNEK